MALCFSGQGQQRPYLESVVFKFNLPSKWESGLPPFADITHLSAMPDEQEILLSMGSMMRVESIESDSNNSVVWICLNPCNCESSRLTELRNFHRRPLTRIKKERDRNYLFFKSVSHLHGRICTGMENGRVNEETHG